MDSKTHSLWMPFPLKSCRWSQVLHCFTVILAVGLLFVLMLLSYTFCELSLRPHQQQYSNGPDRLVSNETQTLRTPEGPDPTFPVSDDPGFSPEEWDRIQQAVRWAEPDHEISNASVCTSAAHSTFIINNFKEKYTVGEEVLATIIAKDFTGTPKRYGGDFFQAKAYSDKLKASVFGEVLDHRNGTYTAQFKLPWAGPVKLAVRLIHSSEAVHFLKQGRRTYNNHFFFWNYFLGTSQQHGGAKVEEVVECKVKWPGVVLSSSPRGRCEYHDAHTGLTWQCHKPPTLTCQDRVFHSGGVFTKHLTALEEVLMDSQHVNRWLTGDSRLISVTATNSSTALHHVYLPINVQMGPFKAVDLKNNIVMHFRSHGLPLHCVKIPVEYFHYMSSEIDGLPGGPDTVIMFNLCAHLASYPLTYYGYRVWLIRRSVVALLKRAPGTRVIIKTANTGYNKKHSYRSDWLTMQVDRILREAFRDMGVYIVDVWQMTACHYLKDNLHPAPLIVQNEVDILLSFICPL
ncbi:NXPE family member 3-like isoform X3 [Alosa sapidissima]|uniref:NXPE family member 3-like isoform X3 n=1 Tax=Alosa sapidissima TaxID=34773 RepID=UPI001C07F2A9|nr:NXPE family member 3-like isoform X3 [Alosa sapidissima]